MDVSKYVGTTDIDFEIEFVTPAFLGGADGNADVRTAPFKTGLRYWWRVLFGKKYLSQLKQKEDEIFGSTEMASKVRIRIVDAKNISIIKGENTHFPEIKEKHKYGKDEKNINILDYLAYGKHKSSNENRKNVYTNSHIEPHGKLKLNISMKLSAERVSEIKDALKAFLMFGCVGSRSRNGYGSMYCSEAEKWNWNNKIVFDKTLTEFPTISNETSVFESKNKYDTWSEALGELGRLYIDARLSLEHSHQYKRRALIAKPIIPQKKEDRDNVDVATRNGRSPKNIYMHVKKIESNKFVGRILVLPVKQKNGKDAEYLNAIKHMKEKFSENLKNKTDNLKQQLGGTAK